MNSSLSKMKRASSYCVQEGVIIEKKLKDYEKSKMIFNKPLFPAFGIESPLKKLSSRKLKKEPKQAASSTQEHKIIEERKNPPKVKKRTISEGHRNTTQKKTGNVPIPVVCDNFSSSKQTCSSDNRELITFEVKGGAKNDWTSMRNLNYSAMRDLTNRVLIQQRMMSSKLDNERWNQIKPPSQNKKPPERSKVNANQLCKLQPAKLVGDAAPELRGRNKSGSSISGSRTNPGSLTHFDVFAGMINCKAQSGRKVKDSVEKTQPKTESEMTGDFHESSFHHADGWQHLNAMKNTIFHSQGFSTTPPKITLHNNNFFSTVEKSIANQQRRQMLKPKTGDRIIARSHFEDFKKTRETHKPTLALPPIPPISRASASMFDWTKNSIYHPAAETPRSSNCTALAIPGTLHRHNAAHSANTIFRHHSSSLNMNPGTKHNNTGKQRHSEQPLGDNLTQLSLDYSVDSVNSNNYTHNSLRSPMSTQKCIQYNPNNSMRMNNSNSSFNFSNMWSAPKDKTQNSGTVARLPESPAPQNSAFHPYKDNRSNYYKNPPRVTKCIRYRNNLPEISEHSDYGKENNSNSGRPSCVRKHSNAHMESNVPASKSSMESFPTKTQSSLNTNNILHGNHQNHSGHYASMKSPIPNHQNNVISSEGHHPSFMKHEIGQTKDQEQRHHGSKGNQASVHIANSNMNHQMNRRSPDNWIQKFSTPSNHQLSNSSEHQFSITANHQASNSANHQVYNNANHQVCNNANHQVPNNASHQVFNNANHQVPNNASHQVFNNANHQISNNASHQVSNNANHQVCNNANHQLSNNENRQVSNNANHQVSNNANHQAYNNAGHQLSNNSTQQCLQSHHQPQACAHKHLPSLTHNEANQNNNNHSDRNVNFGGCNNKHRAALPNITESTSGNEESQYHFAPAKQEMGNASSTTSGMPAFSHSNNVQQELPSRDFCFNRMNMGAQGTSNPISNHHQFPAIESGQHNPTHSETVHCNAQPTHATYQRPAQTNNNAETCYAMVLANQNGAENGNGGTEVTETLPAAEQEENTEGAEGASNQPVKSGISKEPPKPLLIDNPVTPQQKLYNYFREEVERCRGTFG